MAIRHVKGKHKLGKNRRFGMGRTLFAQQPVFDRDDALHFGSVGMILATYRSSL